MSKGLASHHHSRAWTENTALTEKRTVMQQSEQPCDRVKPRTNLPSTACSSKLASQEIVLLPTNALPQKHRGVRGPPTPIVTMMVMFLALRSDCPPLRSQKEGGAIPLRWHQTCQSGTRRTERTNKPSTGVESPTQLRTSKCARFFSKERAKHNPQNRVCRSRARLHLCYSG